MSESNPTTPGKLFDPVAFEIAVARREEISTWAPEVYASIAPEHDVRQPAQLGDQFIEVQSKVGTGRIPVVATHDLSQFHPGIRQITMVTHGCLRNARDYLGWYLEAAGNNFDPSQTIVVAPQFPAAIDLEPTDDLTLRWHYNDWRGGEPAGRDTPDSGVDTPRRGVPTGAFEAKDTVFEHILSIAPDVQELRCFANSEGAQQDERWLTFSQSVKQFELGLGRASVGKVTGYVCNPGTQHYLRPVKPVRVSAMPGLRSEGIDYLPIPQEAAARRWPHGMDNPPPYVRDYLALLPSLYSGDYKPVVPLDPLKILAGDRCHRIVYCIGEEDNTSTASQLPTGVADVYGKTRFERWANKIGFEQMSLDAAHEVTLPRSLRYAIVRNVGHSALDMFTALEQKKNIELHNYTPPRATIRELMATL